MRGDRTSEHESALLMWKQIHWNSCTFCSFYGCFVVFGEYQIASCLKSSFDSLVCWYDNSIGISSIFVCQILITQLLHRLLIVKLIWAHISTRSRSRTRTRTYSHAIPFLSTLALALALALKLVTVRTNVGRSSRYYLYAHILINSFRCTCMRVI